MTLVTIFALSLISFVVAIVRSRPYPYSDSL